MTKLRSIATAFAVAASLGSTALLAADPITPTAAAQTTSGSLDDAGYFRLADRMQQRLDPLWDEKARIYRAGSGGVEPMTNAALLLSHAVAAQKGHDGPSRNDHRARLIAERLVETPPFVTRRPATGDSQAHAPGWTNSMNNAEGGMHLVFDAEVVDGLVHAWRARKELDLPQRTADAIASAIDKTADGSFWRYPAIRLNQVNWYSLVYAAASEVTGTTSLLRHDMRSQLRRFVRGAQARGASVGNFGPGLRFHYLPHAKLNHPMNVDSAEYANIVLSFSRYYEQARAAGMSPLPAADMRLLRQWVLRALSGYWTHGGYMNWDSGLGFDRWHQTKKLGLTQEALIGIAATEALHPTPAAGRWAKYMLDRGLQWFDTLAERAGGVPDGLLFGMSAVPQGPGSARLGAARLQANAARAIAAGLGDMTATEPPALYAFDPDIGRLAITTPAYNTAIIAVNQKAFPYGGIDLARLFDGEQDVAANIGGTGAAAFGMLLRDSAGRRLAASQTARTSVSRSVTPLRLTKAPRGAGAMASSRADRAFAGAFTDLRAAGSIRTGGYALTTAHRFTRDWIETRWGARRTSGSSARRNADVLFPSFGQGTTVTAVMRDGSAVRVAGSRVPLADVAYVSIRSEHSGYVMVPRTRPKGASLHLMRPSRQASAPRPGGTLAVQVARDTGFARASFTARIAVVRDAGDAAAVARRLGA